MSQLYFAYGSNLNHKQMTQRCPDARLKCKAYLKNYKLDFTKYSLKRDGGVADIIPSIHSCVWGAVWEVSELDISKMDEYEGHPKFYLRKTMAVTLEDHSSLNVHTYQIVQKEGYVAPKLDYLNIIIAGANECQLPEDYINSIQKVQIRI